MNIEYLALKYNIINELHFNPSDIELKTVIPLKPDYTIFKEA